MFTLLLSFAILQFANLTVCWGAKQKTINKQNLNTHQSAFMMLHVDYTLDSFACFASASVSAGFFLARARSDRTSKRRRGGDDTFNES